MEKSTKLTCFSKRIHVSKTSGRKNILHFLNSFQFHLEIVKCMPIPQQGMNYINKTIAEVKLFVKLWEEDSDRAFIGKNEEGDGTWNVNATDDEVREILKCTK